MNGVYVRHRSVKEEKCGNGFCEACHHRDQPLTLIELFGISERVCSPCLDKRREWLIWCWLMTIPGAYQDLLDRISAINAGFYDSAYCSGDQSLSLDNDDFARQASA